MKKILSAIIVLILAFTIASPVTANDSIKLMIDEQILEMDVKPVIIEGRTLVPVRAVVERLDGAVAWDEAKQQISIVKGDTNILLTLNDLTAIVNGSAMALDVPAQIINSRTMIPLRFVAESLGVNVEFSNNTVIIETNATESSEAKEQKATNNIMVTSPVKRNEFATLSFVGKPTTEYSIDVFYSTTRSTSQLQYPG